MRTDEQYRHQCEVRHLLQLRGASKQQSDAYLLGCEKKRGKGAVIRLRDDAAKQWRLGNRGEHGDWRE